MAKIAIDVVLLVSEEMMDETIKRNKELLNNFGNKIILNKIDCLPHISLAMGVIDEKDMSKIGLILKEILQEFSIMKLIAESVKINPLSVGGNISSFKIKNIPELQRLHEEIMSKLKKYLSYDVEKPMFYTEVDEGTLKWVRNYAKKHNDSSLFNPHITLGIGIAKEINSPIKFSTSNLAICHLGNYCTCKNILTSIKLE